MASDTPERREDLSMRMAFAELRRLLTRAPSQSVVWRRFWWLWIPAFALVFTLSEIFEIPFF
jgi:hypothetical protein